MMIVMFKRSNWIFSYLKDRNWTIISTTVRNRAVVIQLYLNFPESTLIILLFRIISLLSWGVKRGTWHNQPQLCRHENCHLWPDASTHSLLIIRQGAVCNKFYHQRGDHEDCSSFIHPFPILEPQERKSLKQPNLFLLTG